MNVTLEIRDDLAHRLGATGEDLSRRAREALVAEEYRQGNLARPDLRRLFGLETGDQIDGFLKRHNVWIEYTLEDLQSRTRRLTAARSLMVLVIADTSPLRHLDRAVIQNDYRRPRSSRIICPAVRVARIGFACFVPSNHSCIVGRSATRCNSLLMKSARLIPSRAARDFS